MNKIIEQLINNEFKVENEETSLAGFHNEDLLMFKKIIKTEEHNIEFDMKMKNIETKLLNMNTCYLNDLFKISEKLYIIKNKQYENEINNSKLPLYEKKKKAELMSRRLTEYYRKFTIKIINKNFEFFNENYDLNSVYLSKYFDIDLEYISSIMSETVNDRRDTKHAYAYMVESFHTAFIKSELPMHHFCHKYDISLSRYKGLVANGAKICPNLSKEFINKYNELEKQYEKETITLINSINSYIENGISSKGVKMPFSIVDYYCLTKLDSQSLVDVASKNNLNKELIVIRNLFLGKFTQLSYLSYKKCNENSHIIKHLMNNGIEINEDIKKKIFKTLSDNEIPVTVETFSILAGRESKNQELLPLAVKKEKELILK